jgi:hypothetical protein
LFDFDSFLGRDLGCFPMKLLCENLSIPPLYIGPILGWASRVSLHEALCTPKVEIGLVLAAYWVFVPHGAESVFACCEGAAFTTYIAPAL